MCHFPAPPVFVTATSFVSQDFGICFFILSAEVSALCFTHRHSCLLLVQCHRLRRQHSERNVVVCPFHTPHTAHLKHSVVLTGTGHMRLSQGTSPSTNATSMNREDLLMRSGQVTPILQEGNVSRRTTSNSLPALPSVPSDHLYETVELTNPTTMQVDLLAGATPCRRRVVWTRRR